MEKTHNYQLQLYGETYPINIPLLDEDEFEGASLVQLINHFQLDTIVIWYCMLMQKRILFVGQPAREVGNCCLAAPLLVAPLTGWSKIITPYVALTDISPVMKPTYICGSTNLLFETKTDWWDALGSFSAGCVINNCNIRLSARDREFMKNILSGIQDARGEEWVREQFYTYTSNFLLNVGGGKNMRKEHRKYFPNFTASRIYSEYRNAVQTKSISHKDSAEEKPTAIFKQLQESLKDPEADRTSQIKMLYSLSTKLKDLTEIEQVCNLDGVGTIAVILSESNSQMRKYAVSVLAQLALSISGQIAMMTDQVLNKVIEMLDDPMPNVANAACYCLLKISTLFIGAQTLVNYNVPEVLAKQIFNVDSHLDMKIRCAATLLQIYKFTPTTSRPAGLMKYLHSQLKSPDKKYKHTVLQLLDQWGEEVPQIPLSPEVLTHISRLLANVAEGDSTPDLDTRIHGSTWLLTNLVTSPEIRLELVEAGGVEAILENIKIDDTSALPRYSFSILSIVADSNFGRKKILRYRIIEYALQLLQREGAKPLLLFNVARFLEVCAQHQDTGSFLMECGGISLLLKFMETCHGVKQTLLCIPALGCLRYLMIFFDASVSNEIRNDQKTVQLLYDMMTEGGDIDGDQSGSHKLRELSWSVLRMLAKD